MARSPYFEAKINRWCDEKSELLAVKAIEDVGQVADDGLEEGD